jgi:hypothetical protein
MRRYVMMVLAVISTAGLAACGDDDEEGTNDYVATLNGQSERPTAITTGAGGNFTLIDNGASMTYTLTVSNITGPITGAHIHAIPRSGVAAADTTGGIVVDLAPPNNAVTNGILAQGTFTASNIRALTGSTTAMSMDSLRTLMNAGRTYVNVHTQANPGGHIRGTIVRD